MMYAESAFSVETHTPTIERYSAASELDPLALDSFFLNLPSINKVGDITPIHDALTKAVSQLQKTFFDSTDLALASLRDIDFLASSYIRHGRNPIDDIPGLENVLIDLGSIVGTVPRGTVATYALANPTGERERSFTGDKEESLFIDAVRQTSLALEGSLQDFVNRDAVSALRGFDRNLDIAIQSIISVMRVLPPEYFTDEMRPYFDPLVIDGVGYLGAGGAQLQFVAFDYLLWGMDDTDSTYTQYFSENFNYLTPFQQDAVVQILDKYNQVSLLRHVAVSNDKVTAQAALDALKKMKKFRYPHKKLAEDNFKIRREGQVGSGSYTTDILDVLLRKTEQAIEITEGIVNG